MPESLVISPALRERLGKGMVRDYLGYIRKSPNKTPNQLIDVVYLGYKRWFDTLEQNDLDYFNELLETVSLSVDIDVHWDVTVKKQLQASNVFNNFLTKMRKLPATSKQDSQVVTQTLNEAFAKEYKLSSKSPDIIKALSRDPQLKMIAKRMVRELAKLGYKF